MLKRRTYYVRCFDRVNVGPFNDFVEAHELAMKTAEKNKCSVELIINDITDRGPVFVDKILISFR